MSQPTPSPPSPRPSDRRGFDRQVRFGRILGLVFCAAGFVTIGFGWNGMAKVACPDCQLPYLLSGGATGVALVILGVGLLVMAQVRGERLRLTEELGRVGQVMSRSVGAAPASAGAATNGRVVAGKSTYHRPDCRLVEGKGDLDLVTVAAARASGLTPCRVCGPEREDAGSGSDAGTAATSPGADGSTATTESHAGG